MLCNDYACVPALAGSACLRCSGRGGCYVRCANSYVKCLRANSLRALRQRRGDLAPADCGLRGSCLVWCSSGGERRVEKVSCIAQWRAAQ